MLFSDEHGRFVIVRVAIAAFAIGAIAMAVGGWWFDWRQSMLPWFGLTIVLAGVLLLARHDRRAARLHGSLQHSLLTRGAGLYGVLTLARFLQLELHDLVAGLREFVFDESLLWALLRDWLIGFSMQSLKNSIEAATWPLLLLREFGWVALVAVFAAFQPLSRWTATLGEMPAETGSTSETTTERTG